MTDEELKVYSLDDGEPAGIFLESEFSLLLDAIANRIRDLTEGDDAYFEVRCKTMTRAEFDALPES